MAVDRLTGCSAIIVPRRVAHATRTQCLSMPVPFLGLRADILFLSTTVGTVPTAPSRRGTGPLNRALLHCKTPIERPVKRSVAALLTGSSRQRLNGFIGRTQIGRAPICYSAPNICSSLPWWQFPPAERSGMRNRASSASILNGNSLNPVNAKAALPPAYPPPQRAGGR
jgi:hypothetical protein